MIGSLSRSRGRGFHILLGSQILSKGHVVSRDHGKFIVYWKTAVVAYGNHILAMFHEDHAQTHQELPEDT